MRHLLILAAWSGFLFFYGLSGPLYRTESLRAIIGRASLEGNWLVPTLYGEPFLTKPPGVYVAIAGVSAIGGEVTESTARLPSAIAATLTLFFCYFTLRRYLGKQMALAIAMLLPVSFLWLDKAPSAEIDMLQLAWVMAALMCFLRTTDAIGIKQTGWWIASLLCVAGGFLTKWTAPAFFYLTIGPFLLWRKELRLFFSWRHGLALLVAAGICAAWAMTVVQQVGWETLRDTVGREAAQRFAPSRVGKSYPWLESLTFPFVVLLANLPWSLLALDSLRKSSRETWNDRELLVLQLLHAWTWPNLLFWSLPAQHNVRYVMPICPALVMLGVMGFVGRYRAGLTIPALPPFRNWRPAQWAAATLIVWCVTKVVFTEVVVSKRTADRDARPTGEEIARLVPEGKILYLCRLKDEGVLFYYARAARRFEWEESPPKESFALLLESEWERRQDLGQVELVAELQDQQKDRIYLVRIASGEELINGTTVSSHRHYRPDRDAVDP